MPATAVAERHLRSPGVVHAQEQKGGCRHPGRPAGSCGTTTSSAAATGCRNFTSATVQSALTICTATKGGTDDGRMPANVSLSMRAIVTAGFANDVDDVNQYADAMYAPTANGATLARPDRTIPKITNSRPMVATNSPSHSAPDERVWVERVIASRSNMRLATTAPTQPPTTCATT